MADSETRTRSREALRLIDVDPQAAQREAVAALEQALRDGDHASAAVAGRAAGLAALHLADLDTASDYLQAAVVSARRAKVPELAAEVRMTLAFALTRRGEPRRALRTIDSAVAGLDGVERARAVVQRGLIQQQLGRLDNALNDFRAALPTLRRAADWVWVQRVHSNRAVLYIYRSQLPQAAADLAEAERICRAHGLELPLALVYDNLGFLHARRRDVPLALQYMTEAERRHRALGAHPGTILVDRSELLLSVRLIAEAREAAQLAVDEFTALHRGIQLPQALLLLADAALLDGDPTAARRAADQALRSFRGQHRPEWVALAKYAVLRARLAGPAPARVTAEQLARVADELAAVGWPVPGSDARLLAGRVALERAQLPLARALLRQEVSARRRGPAEIRVRAWHSEALLRLAEGDRRSAAAALRAGLRVAEDNQATAGATDVRSYAAGHRNDLVELGLGLALDGGSPRQVLAWAERGRASVLLARPARPPADPELQRLLTELRATEQAVDDARGAGSNLEPMRRRQVRLERAVRDHVRGSPSTVASTVRPDPDRIAAALGDAALVEYVDHRGDLVAVTVAGSRIRLARLGPTAAVTALTEHLPFALRRLSRRGSSRASVDAAVTLLRHAGMRLDDLLLAPLRREIGDRPLVLVPTGKLLSLSWALLPSCADRPVTTAPSAALWHRASTAAEIPGPVVAVAGPGLPAAAVEAAAVAGLYEHARLLTGADATVAEVKAAMDSSGIAHLAAHGRFRTDNPLFSSLRLADGPLTVYDLEDLDRAPRLVILAACDTGQSLVCAGDELLGLAASFLGLGTVALIASPLLVGDEDTAGLMRELHGELRRGTSPAAALTTVQSAAATSGPTTLAAAAGLVCLGAGLTPTPVHADMYQDLPAGLRRE